MSKIYLNLWDDYFDDGHVPEGEIQETFICVETEMSLDHEKEILSYFLTDLKKMVTEKTLIELTLYNSKDKYPTLEDFRHFQQWRINIKHLNHKQREILVDYYENCPPRYKGHTLVVISES